MDDTAYLMEVESQLFDLRPHRGYEIICDRLRELRWKSVCELADIDPNNKVAVARVQSTIRAYSLVIGPLEGQQGRPLLEELWREAHDKLQNEGGTDE